MLQQNILGVPKLSKREVNNSDLTAAPSLELPIAARRWPSSSEKGSCAKDLAMQQGDEIQNFARYSDQDRIGARASRCRHVG